MADVVDGHLSHPSSPQPLLGLADGFVSPGLRNLHLEKACFLIECRAENISFHTKYEEMQELGS